MTACIERLVICIVLLGSLAGAAENRGMSIAVESAEAVGIADYDPSHFHALVIGINNYKHWPSLKCAAQDAQEVANTLKTMYAFKSVKLLLNEHATREAILEALDSYLSLGPSESLLIYYAGHGWMDPKVKTGYWIPSEARMGKKFDYVANSQVMEDYFKKYRVKHLLVIADSCFSGTLLRGMEAPRESDFKLPRGYKKPSRWVMTSGDLAPVADDTGAGHSPFAARVLQYLKYSDTPAFGVQDLYVYVRKNLQSEAIAQPMKTPEHMPGGEFVFCRLTKPVSVNKGASASGVAVEPIEVMGVDLEAADGREYMVSPGGFMKKPIYKKEEGARFVRRAGDVVYDRRLNRNWMIFDTKGSYSFRRAKELCEEDGEGLYRLPRLAELQSLITKKKRKGDWGRINTSVFPEHIRTVRFWSGTEKLMGSKVFCVDFRLGKFEPTSDTEPCGVLGISKKVVDKKE